MERSSLLLDLHLLLGWRKAWQKRIYSQGEHSSSSNGLQSLTLETAGSESRQCGLPEPRTMRETTGHAAPTTPVQSESTLDNAGWSFDHTGGLF